jgi:uncharacterized membrane protein
VSSDEHILIQQYVFGAIAALVLQSAIVFGPVIAIAIPDSIATKYKYILAIFVGVLAVMIRDFFVNLMKDRKFEATAAEIANLKGIIARHGIQIDETKGTVARNGIQIKKTTETVAEHGIQINETKGTVAEHGIQINEHGIQINETKGTVAEHGIQINETKETVAEHGNFISNEIENRNFMAQYAKQALDMLLSDD